MKEIGHFGNEGGGAFIFEDKEGFFYEYESREEPDDLPDKVRSHYYPTLEALLEDNVPKRGVFVVLYNGRSREQAFEETDFVGTHLRWKKEAAQEEAERKIHG